jgi:hypothetical protein
MRVDLLSMELFWRSRLAHPLIQPDNTTMSFARTAFRSVTTVAGPSRIARNLAAPCFQIRTATPLVSLTSRSEFGCISKRWNSSQSTNKPEDKDSLRLEAPTPGSKPQTIGRIEPRLYVPSPFRQHTYVYAHD